MKTETKVFNAQPVYPAKSAAATELTEATKTRRLSDNYRVITGYPSDNSEAKNRSNPLTMNSKGESAAPSRRKNSEVTPEVRVESDPSAPTRPPNTIAPHSTNSAESHGDTTPHSDSVDFVRQLIPASLRKRRFRVDSFMARLTLPQRHLVLSWLQQDTAETVRTKVAAPPPAGFGIEVHTSTLYRLRNIISNTELNHWIENAMDATCDILDADTSVDTAPMRDAISLLLHSRIMTFTREQTNPVSIDRLVSALTRLEKLKTHVAQRSRPAAAPRAKTTRHKVEVQITTHPGTPSPITIHATHQTLPPSKLAQIDAPNSEKIGAKL